MSIETNYFQQRLQISMLLDDAEKVTNRSHNTRTLKVDLHNKIIEDLIESTGVVPAKYPPKVMLELFSQL